MKRMFIFVLLLSLITGLSGCSSKGDSADDIEARKICNFKRIYSKVDFGIGNYDSIYVDELTGVIYVAIHPTINWGNGFAPLYNADGTLKVWDRYKKGGSNVQQEVKEQD